MTHQAGAYLGFLSMERLRIFLLPPGWDTSPSHTGLSATERYSNCTSCHQKFNSLSKDPVLWSIKILINSTLLDAQNAPGNRISELLDFNILGASMPPDPPSRPLHLQRPLITNVIEVAVLSIGSVYIYVKSPCPICHAT